MPKNDNFDSLNYGSMQSNGYLATPDSIQTHDSLAIDNDAHFDNETKRRKREQVSGYYRESLQMFSPIDQSKYTTSATPLEKVSRKTTLPETSVKKPSRGTEEGTIDKTEQTQEETVKEIAEDAKLSHTQIANLIENLYAAYEAEHSKGNEANMEKLCDIALRMFTLWQRMNSRHDQELSHDHTSNLHSNVKKVQDTFGHIGSIIFTVASSVLSVLGGAGQCFGGAMQLASSSLMSADKVNKLLDIAKGVAATGQGVGIPSQLFESSSQAQRTVHSHRLEEKKRQRDNHTQNAHKATQSSDTAMYNLKEHHKQVGQAKRAIMGYEGG